MIININLGVNNIPAKIFKDSKIECLGSKESQTQPPSATKALLQLKTSEVEIPELPSFPGQFLQIVKKEGAVKSEMPVVTNEKLMLDQNL